jgi:hypothetical protein
MCCDDEGDAAVNANVNNDALVLLLRVRSSSSRKQERRKLAWDWVGQTVWDSRQVRLQFSLKCSSASGASTSTISVLEKKRQRRGTGSCGRSLIVSSSAENTAENESAALASGRRPKQTKVHEYACRHHHHQ